MYCHLNTNEKLSISWLFSETYGVTNYGSGWRKDVVNQCLESGPDRKWVANLAYIRPWYTAFSTEK